MKINVRGDRNEEIHKIIPFCTFETFAFGSCGKHILKMTDPGLTPKITFLVVAIGLERMIQAQIFHVVILLCGGRVLRDVFRF